MASTACEPTTLFLKKKKISLENQTDEKCALAQIYAIQLLLFLSQTSFYAWVNNTCGLRSRCTLFSQSISQSRSDHLSPLLLCLALPHSILLWQLHPLGLLFISLHPLQQIQSQRKKDTKPVTYWKKTTSFIVTQPMAVRQWNKMSLNHLKILFNMYITKEIKLTLVFNFLTNVHNSEIWFFYSGSPGENTSYQNISVGKIKT